MTGLLASAVEIPPHAACLIVDYLGEMSTDNNISILGCTNARRPFQCFGIKEQDRLQHLYIVGKTGTGKTTLLEHLALQDIRAGRGVAVIDPHGDLAERLVKQIPVSRRSELRYLNAPDPRQPYGYNPLRGVVPERVPLAASGLLETFEMLWPEAWGQRMEHVFRNALYALIEAGGATLADVTRLLVDKVYRAQVVARIQNEQVHRFWLTEFPNYHPRYRQEMIAPIQNKVGALLADPRLYRLLVKPPVDLHFRSIMDEGGILIVNLAKGALGSDSSQLLGALIVTTLSLAGLSRSPMAAAARRPFFVHIDEFSSFTTLSVVSLVSELRKFGVALTLVHQHLAQLKPEVRGAVLGNVGTVISFRLGPEDAELFAREFEPRFNRHDLMNLANHDVYLKLLIDGQPSLPFSATTLPVDLLSLA